MIAFLLHFIVFDCGSHDLIFPSHGMVRFTKTTYRSEAHYVCDEGYELRGDSVRVCRLDGWTGKNPSCGKFMSMIMGMKNYWQLASTCAKLDSQPTWKSSVALWMEAYILMEECL